MKGFCVLVTNSGTNEKVQIGQEKERIKGKQRKLKMWQRERERDSKEKTSFLDSDQDSNDSDGTTTPLGGWKLGTFSLNAFDFESLQTSLEGWCIASPRLTCYLEGEGSSS